MITGAFFNHICWICPQNRRIYRFFANGIIVFSTATLHVVGFKAENPRVWGRAPVLFSFYRFFSHTTDEILCNVTTVSNFSINSCLQKCIIVYNPATTRRLVICQFAKNVHSINSINSLITRNYRKPKNW